MDGAPAGLVARAAAAGTDALVVVDAAGLVLEVNQAACTLLGRGADELVGRALGAHVGRAAQARWPEHLRHMRAGEAGRENVEMLVVRPDGSKVRTLTSWGPLALPDGSRVFWHRLTRYDERSRLLEQIAERDERLSTAQEIASLGSWEWTVGSEEMWWSPELYALMAAAPDAAVSLETTAGRIHPEDRDRVLGDLQIGRAHV